MIDVNKVTARALRVVANAADKELIASPEVVQYWRDTADELDPPPTQRSESPSVITDEMVEAFAAAMRDGYYDPAHPEWEHADPKARDFWRAAARRTLEAVEALGMLQDPDVVDEKVWRQGYDVGKGAAEADLQVALERLTMAEGLLRRATVNVFDQDCETSWWYCYAVATRVEPTEAEYLRSLDGEGDSDGVG